MQDYPGSLITFEGGEGGGKTTQIKLLSVFLEERGHTVITTREPGGTAQAEKIRELLVQRDAGAWNPLEECLLHYTARSNHIQNLILPALKKGQIVLCDRFYDSTTVYQGYGQGLALDKVFEIQNLVLGGFKPDLTIILDIDPEAGLTRSEKRFIEAGAESRESTEDRYERLDFSFHKRVRQGFLDIAAKEPERCRIIDAHLPAEEISEKIRAIVLERMDQ